MHLIITKVSSNNKILEELIQSNEKEASNEKTILEQKIEEISVQKENDNMKLQDGKII